MASYQLKQIDRNWDRMALTLNRKNKGTKQTELLKNYLAIQEKLFLMVNRGSKESKTLSQIVKKHRPTLPKLEFKERFAADEESESSESTEERIECNKLVAINSKKQHFVQPFPSSRLFTKFLAKIDCKQPFIVAALDTFGMSGLGNQTPKFSYMELGPDEKSILLYIITQNGANAERIRYTFTSAQTLSHDFNMKQFFFISTNLVVVWNQKNELKFLVLPSELGSRTSWKLWELENEFRVPNNTPKEFALLGFHEGLVTLKQTGNELEITVCHFNIDSNKPPFSRDNSRRDERQLSDFITSQTSKVEFFLRDKKKITWDSVVFCQIVLAYNQPVLIIVDSEGYVVVRNLTRETQSSVTTFYWRFHTNANVLGAFFDTQTTQLWISYWKTVQLSQFLICFKALSLAEDSTLHVPATEDSHNSNHFEFSMSPKDIHMVEDLKKPKGFRFGITTQNNEPHTVLLLFSEINQGFIGNCSPHSQEAGIWDSESDSEEMTDNILNKATIAGKKDEPAANSNQRSLSGFQLVYSMNQYTNLDSKVIKIDIHSVGPQSQNPVDAQTDLPNWPQHRTDLMFTISCKCFSDKPPYVAAFRVYPKENVNQVGSHKFTQKSSPLNKKINSSASLTCYSRIRRKSESIQ